jgi:transposase-like protein
MSQLITMKRRPRHGHRPYRRWSADEKARYLDAFPRSGLSGVAFCRAMDIPIATFTFWQRAARRAVTGAQRTPRSAVAFARVEVVPPAPTVRVWQEESRAGLRVLVRGATGHEVALDGVDDQTAVRVVALVLGRGRRR